MIYVYRDQTMIDWKAILPKPAVKDAHAPMPLAERPRGKSLPSTPEEVQHYLSLSKRKNDDPTR